MSVQFKVHLLSERAKPEGIQQEEFWLNQAQKLPSNSGPLIYLLLVLNP